MERIFNIKIWLIINIIISLIFILLPQIDLELARVFFNAETHSFNLNYHPVFRLIHQGVRVIVLCFVIIAAGYALYCWLNKDNTKLIKIIYLLLTLAIGPGLIVNNLFKDNWGRARPNQIKEFGGNKDFSSPWIISNQCDYNCSFVSGHAATGFWLSSFAFITPIPNRRKFWIGIGIIIGLLLGLVRIMMGGHFLSDVYFSGIIVISTSYLLSKTIPISALYQPK